MLLLLSFVWMTSCKSQNFSNSRVASIFVCTSQACCLGSGRVMWR